MRLAPQFFPKRRPFCLGREHVWFVPFADALGCHRFDRLALWAGGARADEKLFIYNFSDYFAEDTVSNFAKRSGVDARVDFFDSLEVLETRLLAGEAVSMLPFQARPSASGSSNRVH